MTDDPYTMELRLCDDEGMVSHERQDGHDGPGTGATYIETLNFLKPVDGQYTGEPFQCTGSAHLGGKHVRCTSPAHARADDVTVVRGPDGAASLSPMQRLDFREGVAYPEPPGHPGAAVTVMTGPDDVGALVAAYHGVYPGRECDVVLLAVPRGRGEETALKLRNAFAAVTDVEARDGSQRPEGWGDRQSLLVCGYTRHAETGARVMHVRLESVHDGPGASRYRLALNGTEVPIRDWRRLRDGGTTTYRGHWGELVLPHRIDSDDRTPRLNGQPVEQDAS